MEMQIRSRIFILLTITSCFSLASALTFAAAETINARKARELLQNIAGANLKKNQVTIVRISAGATGSEAIVDAQIETAFRLRKGRGGDWHIADVRLGDRQWESFELIEEAVRREKIRRTNALLKKIAEAIEAYRKDFGKIPVTDNMATLLDYLSPRYFNPPERFDYWGRQFEFRGAAGGYRLFSSGPDLKSGTEDDLVIENGILKLSME